VANSYLFQLCAVVWQEVIAAGWRAPSV